MKKLSAILLCLVFMCFNVVSADSNKIIYTQKTDIKCKIDGLFIESYAIDGYMYLPLNKLIDYGFDIETTENEIQLKRKTIFYFDGDYIETATDNSNIIVSENPTPVMVQGSIVNTYRIKDKIVIQADELMAFGEVKWLEESKTISISIVINELISAFDAASDKVDDPANGSGSYISGQQKNGVWNGIVKKGYFQEMTHIGYMVDGEYEGVVFGYREHQPYMAALSELKTVKGGKKAGYCSYNIGYNNKPESPGTIKSISGYYEDDKLKNGEYIVYIDYYGNIKTYKVVDFKEQIVYSTHDNKEYEYTDAIVYLNGEKIEFDTALVSEDDRTLIPLRGLLEKMGASVEWNDRDRSVKVTKDGTGLTVKINYYSSDLNGITKYMDVPPRLVNDKTMIPVRFLSEAFGFNVKWDETSKTISIDN